MIRVFDGRWESINFVDSNNVFVGFDMGASCCETFGWFIVSERSLEEYEGPEENADAFDLSSYVFDTRFREIHHADYDDGGRAVFRMISDGGPDLYLNLYNYHNGYYAHGFEFGVADGDMIEKGIL